MRNFTKAIFCLVLFLMMAANVRAQSWTSVGSIDQRLMASNLITIICSDPSGNVYASGEFLDAYDKHYVAKFDGNRWMKMEGFDALSNNYSNSVFALHSDSRGNIYAGGTFTNGCGNLCSGNYYVAKWDGTSWTELGGFNSLAANGYISTICSDKIGNIYAAGNFKNANGKFYVAKWDGTKWSEVGGTNSLGADYRIKALYCDTNNNLYTGGYFVNNEYYSYVAKWDGIKWSEFGGINALGVRGGDINSISGDNSGNIYVSGYFGINGFVAKSNGNGWVKLGGENGLAANGAINNIYSDTKGNVYASGNFKNTNNLYYVAKWDGTSWSELGGVNALNAGGTIYGMCADPQGKIYCTGNFSNTDGRYYVAKFNGSNWYELSGSLGGASLCANTYFRDITSDSQGNLYTVASCINAYDGVSKWDGTNWLSLGSQNDSIKAMLHSIYTVCIDKANNIYAAGDFTKDGSQRFVAKWDGTKWSELGGYNSLKANGVIRSLCTDSAGNIYAAGSFKNDIGRFYVAKWDGVKWSELMNYNRLYANGIIKSLYCDKRGFIYAAGDFTAYNSNQYIAVFDGKIWQQYSSFLSNSTISTLWGDTLNNIYAGGYFNNAKSKSFVVKCSDSISTIPLTPTWLELGNLDSLIGNANIASITSNPDGSNVYAALNNIYGKYDVVKWDGNKWNSLWANNSFRPNTGPLAKLHRDVYGNIYAIGSFRAPLGGITYVAKYTNIVLPLTLLNLTAQQQNSTVNLSWQTTNEVNTSHFTIQRSVDGTSFSSVGKVAAKGDGNYSYIDNKLTNATVVYYRLQMVDKDGSFNYSKVVAVALIVNRVSLVVYPNPVRDNLFVQFISTKAEKITLQVTDLQGKILQQEDTQVGVGNISLSVNTAALAKGSYVLVVKGSGSLQQKQFVKE